MPNPTFDVFLSHNSKDKPAVLDLAQRLRDRGLNPWVDAWELPPGRPWMVLLEKIIQEVGSATVIFGPAGIGPWEEPEMRACLMQAVSRELPVIPVLLPGAPKKPDLPLFLQGFTWVDFRKGITDAELDRLIWGITGKKPTTFNAAQAAAAVRAELDNQRAEYLKQVAAQCEWIDLGGLAPQVGGELLRLPLDDVFVHLRAERDLPLAEDYLREEFRLRRGLSADGEGREQLDQELDRLDHQRRKAAASERPTSERVEVSSALQYPRIVVLGDPGAGKTTFLRYLARTLAAGKLPPELTALAGRLPIYARLGEYDTYLQAHPHATLLDYLPIAARTRNLPLTAELLVDAVSAGECLFLLDGLDEVAQSGRRQIIRDRVAAFRRDVPGSHIVVTSRIVGYRDAQLPHGDDHFRHFTLCAFGDEEIARFAERWYDAIQPTGAVADPAKQNAQALLAGIRANPGVQRLAANPLLLTLIALIYWREMKLPRRRIDLYRLASEMLLSRWTQARMPGLELSAREATTLLMAVAFHMHRTSSAGVIRRRELEDLLQEQLSGPRRRLTELEAQKEVERFLKLMGEHVGLLYPRGFDDTGGEVFGFLHLTFEEYFAGRELARLWKAGQLNLKHYLHRPRWEEPILLACGHLSDGDDIESPDRFVRQIFEAHSPFDDVLHRDLLLATRCLAEDAAVYQDIGDAVFTALDAAFTTSITPLNESIGFALTATVGGKVEGVATRLAIRKLDSDIFHVRGAAGDALGRFGATGADEVVSALIRRSTDLNWHVRIVTAEALGSLGAAGTPDVATALLNRLDDKETEVREVVAEALGRLGAAGMPGVLSELLARLGDPDAGIREAAALALGGLGPAATPEAVSALISRLDDSEQLVGYAAAEALGSLGPAATPEVMAALLTHLDEPEAGIRFAVAKALAKLGAAGTCEVVSALLARLDHPEGMVRLSVAKALGSLGAAGMSQVVAALLARLRDPECLIRLSVTIALGSLGTIGHSGVARALTVSLDDPDWRVRSAAAGALGSLGAAENPEVVDKLVACLNDSDGRVRSSAAGALGDSAAAGTSQVLDGLVACLGDSEGRVRSAAAGALGSPIAAATPRVVESLIACLSDSDWRVQSAAAGALEKAGPIAALSEVLSRLCELAIAPASRDSRLHDVAFQTLSALAQFNRPEPEFRAGGAHSQP